MRRAALVAGLAVLLTCGAAGLAQAQITVRCFAPQQTACSGHWHVHDVQVVWTLDAPFERVAGCTDETINWDTAGARRSCTARADSGDDASRTVTVSVDRTPPLLTGASPARAPDLNGWYRTPVGVSFTGTDATSGIDACTTATYAGPDSAATAVVGTCRDRAGNTSAPGHFALRFDATAPPLDQLGVHRGDRRVRLDFGATGAVGAQVWRSPGRRGEDLTLLHHGAATRLVDENVRNGRRYEYRVTAVDEAGNAATRTVAVRPGPRLLAPPAAAPVSSPPLLRWTPVRGARYYNVQLFHRGRKVLSAWPAAARLQLEATWRYRGRRELREGRYRWLVWPGRGARAKNRYGRLIGARAFVVDKP